MITWLFLPLLIFQHQFRAICCEQFHIFLLQKPYKPTSLDLIMFGKKKCKRCGKKIDKEFSFCPGCGMPAKDNYENESDWGMLGTNDFFPEFQTAEIKLPMGLNMLFNSLMKNLDKEFKNMDEMFGKNEIIQKKQKFPARSGGISISISTATGKQPEIKVHSSGNIPEFRQKEQQIKKAFEENLDAPTKKLEKFSKLPRKEPATDIRRLSDKVIYEIDLPGVKSLKDVSIIKLENSIEIKAVAKDKAYFKLIPINLPIINKKLSQEKLVLEFGAVD